MTVPTADRSARPLAAVDAAPPAPIPPAPGAAPRGVVKPTGRLRYWTALSRFVDWVGGTWQGRKLYPREYDFTRQLPSAPWNADVYLEALATGEFFATPETPDMTVRDTDAYPASTRSVRRDLSWPSAYQPVSAAFHAQYARYPENHTAHARLYEVPGRLSDAPAIIILGGWSGALTTAMNREARAVGELHRLGYHIVLPDHPYHGRRTPAQANFSGEYCLSADTPRTLEAIAQAVFDVRCLIAWLRGHGVERLAVFGASFGGYIAGLLATVEERIDVLTLLTTPFSTLDLLKRLEVVRRVREAMDAADVDWDALEALDRALQLSRRTPRIERDRILLISGRGDAIVPPWHTELIWNAWGRPHLYWYAGGHLSGFVPRTRIRNRKLFEDFLKQHGVHGVLE